MAKLLALMAALAPAAILASGTGSGTSSKDACPATCTGTGAGRACSFTGKLNVFASSTGYYQFDECGDTVQPVLEIERGVEYTFFQNDITNWYHPFGFAYEPDGALRDVDELEPSISSTGAACAGTNECQAPQYYIGATFYGANVENGTAEPIVYPASGNAGNFGLDFYEPAFQGGRGEWAATRDEALAAGGFNIKLTITDTTQTNDFFYFCHVHGGMSGRIKILSGEGGSQVSTSDFSSLPTLQSPSEFDQKCGTVGLGDYAGNKTCPLDEFFCGDTPMLDASGFEECLHAMDCAMHHEMQIRVDGSDPVAAFMHQMIPHHANAVNMAKALLTAEAINSENDAQGEVEDLVWDIINVQNKQIHFMEAWLKDQGKKSYVDARCEAKNQTHDHDEHGAHAKELNAVGVALAVLVALFGALVLALAGILVYMCNANGKLRDSATAQDAELKQVAA